MTASNGGSTQACLKASPPTCFVVSASTSVSMPRECSKTALTSPTVAPPTSILLADGRSNYRPRRDESHCDLTAAAPERAVKIKNGSFRQLQSPHQKCGIGELGGRLQCQTCPWRKAVAPSFSDTYPTPEIRRFTQIVKVVHYPFAHSITQSITIDQRRLTLTDLAAISHRPARHFAAYASFEENGIGGA